MPSERVSAVGRHGRCDRWISGGRERDFEQTLDLLGRVRFDELFSFKYSREEDPRRPVRDQVEPRIKQERLSILQKLQKEITLEKNKALEGSSGRGFW